MLDKATYRKMWRKKNRLRWNEICKAQYRSSKEEKREQEEENKFLSTKEMQINKDGHKVYIHKKNKKYYYEVFFNDYRKYYISQEFNSRLDLNKDLLYAI